MKDIVAPSPERGRWHLTIGEMTEGVRMQQGWIQSKSYIKRWSQEIGLNDLIVISKQITEGVKSIKEVY